MQFHLDNLAYFLGQPSVKAVYKASPEDFVVTELMTLSAEDEGEHLWCWVEKKGQNTDWLAKHLAKFVGIEPRSVGYAGKKDRQAVTYQWMSLHLPGKKLPDFSKLQLPGIKVLQTRRQPTKLKIGSHQGNSFEITLRHVMGDKREIEQKLAILKKGFPNYFGEQRFGKAYGNLEAATEMFTHPKRRIKKHLKGLYLSSVRSWVFNEILSKRILLYNWDKVQSGDVLSEGRPTGALTGRGRASTSDKVAEIENELIQKFPEWQEGLERAGLNQDRRGLVAVPENLKWQWIEDETLTLNFELGAGSFATAFLREIIKE